MGLFDGFIVLGEILAKGTVSVFLALFTIGAIGFVIGVPVGAFLRLIITKTISLFKWFGSRLRDW